MKKIKLTKRDKILLCGLVCFLIVFASYYFLYQPLLIKQNQYRLEVDQLNNDIEQKNALLHDIDLSQDTINELNTQLKDIKKKYQSKEYSYEVEKLFTLLASRSGLDSQTLTLTYENDTIKEYQNTENATSEKYGCFQIKHFIKTQDYNGFIKYLNDLKEYPNVVINRIEVKNNDEETQVYLWEIEIQFTYYIYS